MTNISVVLPTRQRVPLARRALDSIFETADRPEQLEVILYVDRDDAPSHAIEHSELKIIKLVLPRAKMGAMTQACYAASTGRLIMLFNDDVVCQTAGWDTALLDAFDHHGDDVALVWANDLFRSGLFPNHPILSRTVCELMGGVCPCRYHRDYIDMHIYDIFCALSQLGHDRLIYLSNVIFEHMHVEAGKAAADTTSVKHRKTDDELTYIAWAEERRLAAARLARHIDAVAATPVDRAWQTDTAANAPRQAIRPSQTIQGGR